MAGKQVKQAFFIVWIVVSIAVFLILTASFVLTPETAGKLIPACEWKQNYDRECPLCGMTKSFMHIAGGELDLAREANRAGTFLYFLFLLNEISFAGVVMLKRRRVSHGNAARS